MKKERKNIFKVAVIGCGASGISCAYRLQKLGIQTDVYERSHSLGGLANGTKISKGTIDTFYHHLFKSDEYILNFLKELKLDHLIKFKKTKTAHIWGNKYFNISSIFEIFSSKLVSKRGLSRLLIGGAIIKFLPNINFLKNRPVYTLTQFIFGKEASNKIWKPLIKSKFGDYFNLIPYSWLNCRIKDRSLELGYVIGGFEKIYYRLSDLFLAEGGKLILGKEIKKIEKDQATGKLIINKKLYDKLVITTSPKVNKKLLEKLNYKSQKINYLGAVCGILEFNKKPIPSYWVGIASEKNKIDFV